MKTKYFITMIMVLLAYHSPGWSQSSNQNYIVKKKMTDTSGSASRDVIQYYDGLGRPNETISKKFTPNGYDMVTRQEYDAFGRESKTWLPSPSSNTNGNYNGTSTAASKYGDSYPYSETVYEASPLNRPERQYGPGQAWRSNDRKVKTENMTNSSTTELKCALYSVSGYNLVRNGLYSNNSLFVTKITDENNNVSYEFKDKLDRVVLQRQMENQEPHDTYYVYDDYGNLCFVLPPLAADNTTNTSITYSETSDPISKFAYLYRYDNRNRCTEKKLPGAGWIYIVYDKADRMVLSQDAEQRNKQQWAFYKYDNLGRMILSGYKQGNNTAFQQDKTLCSNAVTVESRVNGGGVIYRYTNNSYPSITMADVRIINYYDDHLWLDYFNNDGTPDRDALTDNTKLGFGTKHNSEKGMLTGNYTKLLDASARRVTANYYDNKGQLVQNCVINMKAGFDRTFFNYNFDGSVDKKQSEQTGMASQPNTTEFYKYNYDTQGRLTSTDYTLNNATTPVRISTLTYNELGQLKSKTTAGLEATNYTYNIRSWMENITGSRFSEQLLYTSNIHYGAPIFFNGNISAMRWIAQDKPGQYRGYDFNYDQLGRLINASYGEGINLDSGNGRYDEHSAYDKHGNFTYIIRSGRHDDNTFSTIDNIHCQQYDGNKVVSIHDFNGDEINSDVMEFKNGNWGGIEYTYDANGNMTKDLNKKISLIQYNELNLPKRIDFQNGNWIEYTYDASGVKHRTKHYIVASGVGNTTTTEYLGNKIFKNGQLDKILTEEGYVAKQGSVYNAFYYIKDHLGNNRVVIDQSGNTQQVTNYYPFGASYAELPARTDQGIQPYKYNGKELDREGGLDMYDYGARMYDPAIGRFSTMDPLAEKYYSISPYAYCANNPVNRIDPDGMDWYIIGENGEVIYLLKDDINTDIDVLWKNGSGEHIMVNDKDLLPQLMKKPATEYKGHYGVTSNEDDAFNVFKFAADNTSAEWGLNAYSSTEGNQYLIRTSHNDSSVRKTDGSFNESDMLFTIHSHPFTTEEGASGYSVGPPPLYSPEYTRDMSVIYGVYERLKDSYPDGFPNHYVYNVALQTLYHYTPWNDINKKFQNVTSSGALKANVLNKKYNNTKLKSPQK